MGRWEGLGLPQLRVCEVGGLLSRCPIPDSRGRVGPSVTVCERATGWAITGEDFNSETRKVPGVKGSLQPLGPEPPTHTL